MAFEVTEHFVHQFGRGIDLLAQQQESRVRGSVRTEIVVGKTASIDQIGTVAASEKLTRHGPTPLIEAPHHRRYVRLTDYEQGIALDKEDQIRMLNDPTNTYSRALAAGFGRKIDDVLVTEMTATASTGETGTGSEAFDTTNQRVAVAATPLNILKLLQTKEIFDRNEESESDRFMLINARQLKNLLNTTQVQSADFNTVKALVMGELDTFVGFKFIRAERIGLVGSDDRVLAWQKSGVLLAIGKDSTSRISERSDLSYLTQAYHCMTIGATRLRSTAVVDIICNP